MQHFATHRVVTGRDATDDAALLPDGPEKDPNRVEYVFDDTQLKEALGEKVVGHYVHTAEWEQFEYDRRVTDWELMRGFERS